MSKKYLLKIEPYVYIALTTTRLMLYNTLNGKHIETNDEILLEIIKSDERLLNEKQLEQNRIYAFIKLIEEDYIGELIKLEDFNGMPAQIKAEINVLKSVEDLSYSKLDYDNSFNNYLNEVTIYLNGSSEIPNCAAQAYKQFFFPLSKDYYDGELRFNDLINFIGEIFSFGVEKINIVAGDLLSYKKLDDLMIYINNLKIQYSVYFYFNQLMSFEYFTILKDYIEEFNFNINVLLMLPLSFDNLKEFIEILPINEVNLCFIVRDDLDFEFFEKQIANDFHKYSFKFLPFYTEGNINFFSEAVFLEENDIFLKKFEQKELMSKLILNINNFGKLILLSNGLIYTNINRSEIGQIKDLELSNIIKKALSSEDFGWMKTRSNVIPCNECIYCAFCPPISSYEYAIGKYNLCHVWEN